LRPRVPKINKTDLDLDAYARGHYAEEAQDLLTELIETYKVTNDVRMKPEGKFSTRVVFL
jgi:hypothetical protein